VFFHRALCFANNASGLGEVSIASSRVIFRGFSGLKPRWEGGGTRCASWAFHVAADWSHAGRLATLPHFLNPNTMVNTMNWIIAKASRLGRKRNGSVFVEYLLLLTLVGIGVIAGLAAVRGALISELFDLADAIKGIECP